MTQDANVQAAKLALGLMDPGVVVQEATVAAYAEAAPPRVTIRPDGGRSEVPARSAVNRPLVAGTRVLVRFDPPGGALVVGIIGRVPPPFIETVRTSGNWALAAATELTLTWDTTPRFSHGLEIDANGHVAIPWTGIYATSASIQWTAAAFAANQIWERWLSIQRLDETGALLEQVATHGDSHISEFWRANWVNPSHSGFYLNAGNMLRVRGYSEVGTDLVGSSANWSVCWVGQGDADT